MRLRLPALPSRLAKLISLGLFGTCAALEFIVVSSILSSLKSFCIDGNEVTEQLTICFMMTFGIIVNDIYFAILVAIAFPLKNCIFGADINSIAYNLVSGLVCLASVGPLLKVKSCGNPSFLIVSTNTCVFFTISGGAHIANSVVNLIFLQNDERC